MTQVSRQTLALYIIDTLEKTSNHSLAYNCLELLLGTELELQAIAEAEHSAGDFRTTPLSYTHARNIQYLQNAMDCIRLYKPDTPVDTMVADAVAWIRQLSYVGTVTESFGDIFLDALVSVCVDNAFQN